MNPVSKSLIYKNKAISFALLIMYSLIIALLVATSCVSVSFDKTFNTFFDDYKVYDLLLTTTGTPVSLGDDLMEIKGIEAVSGKLAIDRCVEYENGRVLLTRIMSVDSNPNWKIYDVKNNCEITNKENCVMISAYFADSNDIDIGSKLLVNNGQEDVELFVTNIISCPETIGVGSYIGSWYDMRDYGFIYVSNDLNENVFNVSDICNAYKILVSDSANIEEIETKIQNKLGSNFVSISRYNDSNIKKQLDSSIDTVKSITLYLPLIVIVIGIMFSLLFIYQVTRKSRKDIALLRAIGYSNSKVLKIFDSYILSISISATLIGSLLGYAILRFMINIYKEFYFLPYVKYDADFIKTGTIIVIINVLALITSRLACKNIGKIEPAIAFGELEVSDNSNLPKYISNIKCNPFTKLSITMIYRNKTRVIVVFMCTLACMILSMLSISIIFNKNRALEYTFDKRYDFDLAVFCTDKVDLEKMVSQDFVNDSYYLFQNDYLYDDEVMRIEVAKGYENVEGVILEKGFARRHNLKVGDYIELKGIEIEVTGIHDQYLCSTQYISFDTLKKMGIEKPNLVSLYLNNKEDKNRAMSYASKLDSFLLSIDIDSLRLCAKDTMAKIDMPCYVIILFSGLIGFIIMYNMALISFDKRRKDFSTLRALGTDNYRIVKLLLGESIGELVMSLIIAPISFPLLSLILTLISSSSEEYVLFSPFSVLGIAFAFTSLYTILGVLLTYLSIRKIDIALELNM